MVQTRPKSPPPEDHETLLSRLSRFLHRSRFVFWTIFAAMALFLVTYFVYSEISKSRLEKSTGLAEEAEDLFSRWEAEEDKEIQAELSATLLEKLDLVQRKYPRQYGGQRARYIRAQYLARLEQWEQAAEAFSSLADSFPRSYLAPISIFNAGVSMENAANEDAAIEAYSRLIADYGASYLTPHALFSRGRLYEAIGDMEKAMADYTTLSDEHPASSWTRLGKNRIIALQIKGQ